MKQRIQRMLLMLSFCLLVGSQVIAAQDEPVDIFLVNDTMLYGATLVGAIVGGVLGYVCSAPPKKQWTPLEIPEHIEVNLVPLSEDLEIKLGKLDQSHWMRRLIGTVLGAAIVGGGTYWWLSKKTPQGRLKKIEKRLASIRKKDLMVGLEQELYREVDGVRRRVRRPRIRMMVSGDDLIDDVYEDEDRPFLQAQNDTLYLLEQLRDIYRQLRDISKYAAKYDVRLVDDVETLIEVDRELYEAAGAFRNFIEDSPYYDAEHDRARRLDNRKKRESAVWWEEVYEFVEEKIENAKKAVGRWMRTGSGEQQAERPVRHHGRGFSLQVNLPGVE